MAYKAWQNRPKISMGSRITSSLLALGAATGVFLGTRALVKNFKQGIREQQALSEGNPAAFATQLKMAFENDNYFGWGTDEEMVFTVLESIPNGFMNKVQRAYRDLYGRNLSADLQDELSSEEFVTALQIINSKT
ncbi:hypothetical protein [Marivirga lumbricoides]